jgi:hypothetical protein
VIDVVFGKLGGDDRLRERRGFALRAVGERCKRTVLAPRLHELSRDPWRFDGGAVSELVEQVAGVHELAALQARLGRGGPQLTELQRKAARGLLGALGPLLEAANCVLPASADGGLEAALDELAESDPRSRRPPASCHQWVTRVCGTGSAREPPFREFGAQIVDSL